MEAQGTEEEQAAIVLGASVGSILCGIKSHLKVVKNLIAHT